MSDEKDAARWRYLLAHGVWEVYFYGSESKPPVVFHEDTEGLTAYIDEQIKAEDP